MTAFYGFLPEIYLFNYVTFLGSYFFISSLLFLKALEEANEGTIYGSFLGFTSIDYGDFTSFTYFLSFDVYLI